jgi:hypothetical protein
LTGGKRAYPEEYIEMKFCEHFNLSPLEYARIPRKKIELWGQMLNIENEVAKVNEKRVEGRKNLGL